MAVEVEKLVVTLEARIAAYNRGLAEAQAVTARQASGIEARFAAMSRNLKASASTAAIGIGSALGGIAGYLGASAVLEYANSWTRVTRSLDANGQAFGITLKSASEMNALANDARVDLSAYSALYIRTSAAIRDYGYEAGTAEKVTSTLSKALKIGGATASEQASVLLQFSQALQKGKLDGDEFRTVMENAGIVQELLAKRLGVTKGEIIKMAAAGKLQIPDLVGALADGGAQVERIFKQMPATIDEAFTVLRNNVIQFIGEAGKATGASQALSDGIVTISHNLSAIAVAAGALLSTAALRMAAFAAATVAVANPLTLVVAALGALATAYGVFGDEVKTSGDGIVSLKDSFAAFLDVAGGRAQETMQSLADTFQAVRERAAEWGLTWDNVSATAGNAASALAAKAKDLDAKFGGFGAAIVSAFVEANKQLADTLGITTAINAALEDGTKIAERARQIALARGVEEKNFGGRLADYRAGKIQDQKKNAASSDPNAKLSQFEREAAQIRKRTAALQAEIATIGQSVLMQEKAKAAAELRAAAEETARKRGSAVTKEEIAAIETLSTRYAEAQAQAQFLNALQAKRDGIDALNDEIAMLGLYGEELDAARIRLELLNEAKRLGRDLTPAEESEIDMLARKTAARKAERDAILEVQEASKEALKGFISDMRQGVSATEALANALDNLATKLIESGIDKLVTSLIGGALGGGYTGSIAPFADGGIFANGRRQSLKRFAGGGISNTAAIFGEAGPEAAIPLKGGKVPVELRMPSIPTANAPALSAPTQVALTINMPVQQGSPEGVEKMKRELIPTIRSTIHDVFNRDHRFARSKL